ncbi:helix-turn-helix domain-containing protein [Serratia sp. L9]|uniref:helix-turn-helix domain-containing protein n=1 Tax=Serratia sp. L9 TaxID=3423946 RepID=UPI003D66638F
MMLNINIRSHNEFYKLGLLSFLEDSLQSENNGPYTIMSDPNSDIINGANIIFTEQMAILNIFSPNKVTDNGAVNHPHITIHITLNTSWLFLEGASTVVGRIINWARLSYKELTLDEFYRKMMARNHTQLSRTENQVVMLMSQGYDTFNISKILNRSEKTVYTHRRNAIKKLGMHNRLELYKYTLLLKEFYCRKNIFLCL